MINNTTIEICIGNIDDAVKVASYPIDRIELNSALELGGLSPSLETIRTLKKTIAVPLCCMCRPRGGDFCYSEREYETMLMDAEAMLKAGADGIVFGFLHKDRTIDVERTGTMTDLVHSYQKEAVFHKAFDETEDLDRSTRELISCHVDRILTSGRAVYPEILQGCKILHDLHEKYQKQIAFLPGGGVRIENIRDVLQISGCGQVHMTSKRQSKGGYLELDEVQLQEMLRQIETMKE
ncbi:MAG: copper homeostasis protein CutC [Erysipelotrichaceae bacterium]|nr:copper homeostasis protein CutC [Erysipelotrichaceae bacterium]